MSSRSSNSSRYAYKTVYQPVREDAVPMVKLSSSGQHIERKQLDSPASLVRTSVVSLLLGLLLDAVLLAVSLAFLVFGFIVRAYNVSPVEKYPQLTANLQMVAKYAPTIFPILFAAVGSRTAKSLIQWRLQRGERIASLDLLASSTTVGGAVTAQVTARSMSMLGVALIIIWTFSPIGGQASLRVMDTANHLDSVPMTFNYVATQVSFSDYETGDDVTQVSIVNALFFGSLLTSQNQRLATVDPWKNVKIPMIEPLEGSLIPDNDGWLASTGNNVSYVSPLGIPVSPKGTEGQRSEYNIETSYLSLECPRLFSSNESEYVWDWAKLPWTSDNATGESFGLEVEAPWIGAISDWAAVLASNTSGGREPQDQDLQPRTIFFSASDGFFSVSGSLCEVRSTYIEAQINCEGTACATQKVRRSRSPASVSAWTVLDSDEDSAFRYFAGLFVDAVPVHEAVASVLSVYLMNPADPLSSKIFPPAATLPPDVYALRLGQLLNTFWTAAVGVYAIPQGINVVSTYEGDNQTAADYGATKVTPTNGTQTTTTLVIRCHNGWLVALVISASVLLLACAISIVVRFYCDTPELALNFSSLVRDNPYVQGSDSSSALDATKRAQWMGDTVIKFGDVRPNSAVGHLTFATFDRVPRIESVQKKRLYS